MSKAHSRANYEAILKFFREETGSYKEVAKRLGLAEGLVRSAFETGWPEVPWGKAVRDVLAEEQEEMRALRRDLAVKQIAEEESVRAKAREDMMETRLQEGRAAKAARANALGAAVTASQLIIAMRAMVGEVERRTKDPKVLAGIPLDELRQWMRTVPQSVYQVSACVKMALEIERIVAGEPLAMIGFRLDNMTPEQLQGRLQELLATMTNKGQTLSEKDKDEIEWDEIEVGGAYVPAKSN